MKQVKKRLLFVLASVGGVFSGGSDYEYFSLGELYWRAEPFAKSSVREALAGLLEEKLVAKIERGGRVSYRLSSVGREVLLSFYPKYRVKRSVWDKGWRMVVYDSMGLRRSEVRWLRGELRGLGLKPLSRGVWVTPLDVAEVVKRKLIERGLGGGVVVLITRRFVVGDDREFTERVWGLSELNDRYSELVSESRELYREVRGAKALGEGLKKRYLVKLLWFGELLRREPGLPKALLAGEWGFGEVEKVMGKLSGAVLELEREQR